MKYIVIMGVRRFGVFVELTATQDSITEEKIPKTFYFYLDPKKSNINKLTIRNSFTLKSL